MQEKLREFFICESKAKKLIDCSSIQYSQIEQFDWACNYITQKCLNEKVIIKLDKQIEDVEVFFETLFNGSLKLFKHKNIKISDDIPFNGNICVRNGDTDTQSLSTESYDLAVLALNNCTSLTRLDIMYGQHCQYQELKAEKLSLQELIIYGDYGIHIPLISDILDKSKDTLSKLECDESVDLSSLRNSMQLRTLIIKGYIRGTN